MSDALPAGLPPAYRQIARLSFGGPDNRLWWLVNALSVFTLLVGVTVFFVSGMALGGAFTVEFDLINLALIVITVVLTTVAHEVVHGCSMRAFGARPIYGFKPELGAAYCAAPGHAFTRPQFIIIVLAPLLLLTVVLFGVMMTLLAWPVWQLVALAGAFNITGAIGDLYLAVYVARQPAHAYVVDDLDGIRVCAPAAGAG